MQPIYRLNKILNVTFVYNTFNREECMLRSDGKRLKFFFKLIIKIKIKSKDKCLNELSIINVIFTC